MAIMHSIHVFTLLPAFGFVAVVCGILYYRIVQPGLPKNAPALTREAWPVGLQFATHRWDFSQRAKAHSKTGQYSFYFGDLLVVGLSGEEGRKTFFDNKTMSFSAGYAGLVANGPSVKEGNKVFAKDVLDGDNFDSWFAKRLANMMKGNQLKQLLPQLLKDARTSFDKLANDPKAITDPFDSIYRLVFMFTMRTVACNDIADDQKSLSTCLRLFETIEGTLKPLTLMYPWLPHPASVRRTLAGARLYMIFQRIIDARKKAGVKGNDMLQYLLDQGDDASKIIQFVLAALFAGQLNSGVNAAWVLVYLASKPYWFQRVYEEVVGVADRYCPDSDLPLKDRLMQVPLEAFEGELPIADLCLRDSIRLQSTGNLHRKNVTNEAIPITKSGAEVIPPGAYATFPIGDVHYNPDIYSNPDEWDPARYLPDRAEDKKDQYAFAGWGLGRHPCGGMRFAKLENNLIAAFFVAYFADVKLCDMSGNLTDRIPPTNRNHHTAHLPKEHVYLKYTLRQ